MPVQQVNLLDSINHIPVRATYRRDHFLCVLRYLLAVYSGAQGRRTVVTGNLRFGDSVLWELRGKRENGLSRGLCFDAPAIRRRLYSTKLKNTGLVASMDDHLTTGAASRRQLSQNVGGGGGAGGRRVVTGLGL